jgi:hypothetical protein
MEPKQSLEAAPTPYRFTADELARLSRYKAAVKVGFYSDTRAEPSGFDGIFTRHELERLAIYRAAIKAGFYTDDVAA